ncbi:MAG: BREX system ATP-binding domain-containing protein [Pseudomonadota bacterium]
MSGVPEATQAPLDITLEFMRKKKMEDPYGFHFESQGYGLRLGRGVYGESTLDWTDAVGRLLTQVLRPNPPPEQVKRLGEELRKFLGAAGFGEDERRIGQAVQERRPVRVTIVSGAAELYALPWEILTLSATDERLFDTEWCRLRYEWPGVPPTARPTADWGAGAHVLFAWSAVGGAVPVREHRLALAATGAQLTVVPHASRTAIRGALDQAAAAGHPVTIVHLLCHGTTAQGGAFLVMSAEEGAEQDRLDPDALRDLLCPHAATVHLVTLCACLSGQAATPDSRLGSVALALHRGTVEHGGLEAVIASRFPLSTSGSGVLARALYPALFSGGLDVALTTARRALKEAHTEGEAAWLDHASLQLYHAPQPAVAEGAEAGEEHRPDPSTRLVAAWEERRAQRDKGGDTEALDQEIADLLQEVGIGAELRAGVLIGERRYELIASLGDEADYVVWQARDHASRALVVLWFLKFPAQLCPAAQEEFFAAAHRTATIQHRSVQQIVEPARVEGRLCFFSAAYVPGGTLEQAVLTEGTDPWRALRVVLSAGEALSHAHEQGVLHGDIRPRTLLVDGQAQARVSLFRAAGGALTWRGGPRLYVAPEVLRQGIASDPRSEVFSLGMTAVFCLHGEVLPVEVKRDPAAFIARLDTCEGVRAVLTRAVSDAPEARQASVASFCGDLREALEEAREARGDLPVVGRQGQLATLREALERARDGQLQMRFIAGDPGEGKTALLEAVTRLALDLDVGALVVESAPDARTGPGEPYQPFIELLAQLCGDVRDMRGAFAQERACRLRRLARLSTRVIVENSIDLIDSLVPGQALLERTAQGGPAPWRERLAARVARGPGEVSEARIFKATSEVIEALSERYLVVLLLDDLQWADRPSLDLLAYLADQLSGARVLIVGTYRPNEVALGRGGGRHPLDPVLGQVKSALGDVAIDLNNLPEAERRALTAALVDRHPNHLDEPFRQALLAHTGGQPLFVLEVLRELRLRGCIVTGEDGRLVTRDDLDPGAMWTGLPSRVEGIIEERIGRLEHEAREILDAASVEGVRFTAMVVGRVQGIAQRHLLVQLSRELDRRHRLVCSGATQRIGGAVTESFSFSNAAFQRYLYDQLSDPERRLLHHEIAALLEELCAGQPGELALGLAHHHDLAEEYDRAVDLYLAAGARSVRLSAYPEAEAVFRRAVASLDHLPDDARRAARAFRAHVQLANIAKVRCGWDSEQAREEYDRARELAASADDDTDLTAVLTGMWAYYLVSGDLHAADGLGREIHKRGARQGAVLTRIQGCMCLANVHFWLGELGETRRWVEELGALYDPKRDQAALVEFGQDPFVTAQIFAVLIEVLGGRAREARRLRDAGLRHAEGLDHPFSLAIMVQTDAWERFHEGDAAGARDAAERLAALSREHGFPAYEGISGMFRGWARAALGEGGGVLEEIRVGHRMFSPRSTALAGTLRAVLLARVHALEGDMAALERTASDGIADAEQRAERLYLPALLTLRARALVAHGDLEGAQVALQRALDLARASGALLMELEAALAWVELQDAPTARAALTDALAGFAPDDDLPVVQRARARAAR